MEDNERELVIEQLQSSETLLLSLVKGLTVEQWNFQESRGRWSIAENMEHLVLFERFIAAAIDKCLQEQAEPEKKAVVAEKEPHVLTIAGTRSSAKLKAREVVCPCGKWFPVEVVAEFRKTRAETIEFARHTESALRDHFFPHISLGDLDCYQWLILIGKHSYRHALQIEEVKSHPDYPAVA